MNSTNQIKIKTILIETIACLFILLFMYASLSKITDFENFKIQLSKSPLLTDFTDIVSILIPVLEVLISILLTFQKYRLIGFYFSFGIMVMFTAYIIAILNFIDYIPCSCGGILSQMNWQQHLVFNIIFVILGLTGIVLQARFEGVSSIEHKYQIQI